MCCVRHEGGKDSRRTTPARRVGERERVKAVVAAAPTHREPTHTNAHKMLFFGYGKKKTENLHAWVTENLIRSVHVKNTGKP